MPVTPCALRDELIRLIRQDMLGPADGPEEEISAREFRLTDRYIVGGLAPGGKIPFSDDESAPEDNDEADEEAELEPESFVIAGPEGNDGSTEKEASLVDSLLPSSAGFTFLVDGAEQGIHVHASWGQYIPIQSEKDENGRTRVLGWKRVPVCNAPVLLALKEGKHVQKLPEDENIVLASHVRRRKDIWYVSLFIINARRGRRNERSGKRWIFQVELSVESCDGQKRPIFVQRPISVQDLSLLDAGEKREMEDLALRYRHCGVFGKGRGCSIRADRDSNDPPHVARRLSLDFLPVTIVPGQTPRTEEDDALLKDIVLDMHELSVMDADKLFANLGRMAAAYAAWTATLEVSGKEVEYRPAAQRAKQEALRALERLKEGIAVLRENPKALLAFRFANRAMHAQRVHSIFAARVRAGEYSSAQKAALLRELNVPGNRSWRLFQLAFLLLNIAPLTDPLHKDRSSAGYGAVADLLWFSTGGGKTEAYLGLTAYTLAIRRLQGSLGGLDAEHGVAVFMRYTLRLLTLQQFQRASALICACEALRRKNVELWGREPFRLGLWVGSRSTPNSLNDAQNAVSQNSNASVGSSPRQLRSCPWCGARITENDISVFKGTTQSNRCITFCGDSSGACLFTRRHSPDEGLPVMVVDEEIYRRPPSFLISTVDKFAQMPWKGEAEMLFGRVEGLCPRHGFVSPDSDEHVGDGHRKYKGVPAVEVGEHPWLRPPDLVIQDELHLISGPLGSMVALYENAVDTLCEWTLDGATVRPKIVASTATIRRAGEQIRKLFNRRVEVFPPPGIDSRDNFFSLERPVSDSSPGRAYVGLCSIGHRMPPVAVRLYATTMAAAQKLFLENGDMADPWMTALGYFNSVRELAGMRRLVEDVVRGRLADRFQRGLAPRRIRRVEELTSRQSSQRIPSILEQLSVRFSAEPEEDAADKRPYDVVLATNMISVGMDVDRLGLMLVHGQPKTTSEYIQASSRVGRSSKAPGLVLMLYNWARPRDMSHFEEFYAYHESFQRHVEALSVTPFAGRALDRGLSGVLVSLVRLMDTKMNANASAIKLQDDDSLLLLAMEKILQRAQAVSQSTEVVEQVRGMLEKRRDIWLERAHHARKHVSGFAYKKAVDGGSLLFGDEEPAEIFYCPSSMRDVENTVNLCLDMSEFGLSVEN